MKFVCKHCDSKYTIADDKVRNKILKIRCKKCSNIIEVRDPGLGRRSADSLTAKHALEAPSALENKFAASFRPSKETHAKGTPGLFAAVKRSAEVLEQKETDRVHWFVAIENSPVGPMSAQRVHTHRQAGRVSDESLSWKEGMVDWIPLRNCKELVGLLAHIDIEVATAAEERQQEDQDHPKLGLFAEEQETLDKSPLKGRSVGIIAERIDAPKSKPKEENSKNSITFGNVPGLAASLGNEDLLMDFDRGGVGALHTLAPPRPGSQSQNRIIMLAAIGFFFAAVCTLGVAVFSGSEAAEVETSVKTVERVIEKVIYLDRPEEKSPAVSVATRPQTDKAKATTSRKSPRTTKRKTKEKKESPSDARTRELMERLGVSAPGGGVPIGTKSKTQGSGRGSSKASLTENQLKSVVNRNKSRMKSCYERALRQGEAPDNKDIRVNFKVKVGSSGMVKYVSLGGEGARVVTLNSCLKRSVKKWVFPSSSGDSDLEFPFVFTPR
ncbi:MAG: AgmX/PglI C-terminal domain-containing protein [Proteobacteria bacterium]|nr:AgmX/PglI C-terminal domain-containing protein [Pseudomonadota bacterium]